MAENRIPTHREALGLPEKRTVGLAISFAEIAKRDLQASGILYQRKLYPQAIFELQQGVDKGVKAVGLLVSLVRPTRDDLTREVGHGTTFGILVRLPERLAQLRRNLGFIAAAESLKEGKELLMKLGLPWAIPDSSEMDAKINDDRTAKAEVDRLRNLKPADLWKITLEFNPNRPPNPSILKLLKEAEVQWKPLDKFQRLFERKFAPQMSDPGTLRYILNVFGKAFPEIAPLAFVMMWHDGETRYPPIDGADYWDPKRYTTKSGLVRMHPDLAKHAKRLCDGALTGARAALDL